MLILYGLGIALLFGIWRAWFGGSFNYCPRFIKYIALFGLCIASYWINDKLNWQDYHLYLAMLSFMMFWARSHGAWFCVNDTGDGGEGRIKWIDKFLFMMFGVDESRTFAGNCVGMFVRYSIWSIITAIFLSSAWFCLAGLVVTVVYGACGKLFPNKFYTKIAEYVSGFLVGLMFFFCV